LENQHKQNGNHSLKSQLVSQERTRPVSNFPSLESVLRTDTAGQMTRNASDLHNN